MKQAVSLVKHNGVLFTALLFCLSTVFGGQAFAGREMSRGADHRSEQATMSLEKAMAKKAEHQPEIPGDPSAREDHPLRQNGEHLRQDGEHRNEKSIKDDGEEIVEEPVVEAPVE